jgi:apolipoprotein N-acyltransferase
VTAVIVAVNGCIAEAALAIEKYAPPAIRSLQLGDRKYGRELYPEYPLAPQSRRERLDYLRVKGRIALPYLSTAIGLLIFSHLLGLALLNRPPIQPIESALNVGIVQGNIGNEVKHYRAGHQYALERYTQGYTDLADRGVDLVVTPETALPFTETNLKNTNFYRAILDRKIPALVGAFGEAGRSFTNSMLTINGDGEIFSRYDKWKLVPLGEYIPFEQLIGKFIDRLSPLDSHLVAGKFAPIVNTPVGDIIFGICYDSAYAEHFRQQALKGDFIVTASNDAHYGAGMASQHHAQDLLRAIETDRWTVRASNTGYSAIIDPHGRTQWISDLNQFVTHAHPIYRQHTQTLYVRFGDWLTPLLGAIGLLLFILL